MTAAFAIEETQAYKLVTYTRYFCYLKLSKQVIHHNNLPLREKWGKNRAKDTAAASRRQNRCFMPSSAKHIQYLHSKTSENSTIKWPGKCC